MRKKVFGLAGLLALCAACIGCKSVHDYSLRSYQGPLPLSDYRYASPDALALPASSR